MENKTNEMWKDVLSLIEPDDGDLHNIDHNNRIQLLFYLKFFLVI